jgi:predicted DNA-binding transcriptional regulator AlpA
MTLYGISEHAKQALLKRADVCRVLGISPATFHRLYRRGGLPPPCFSAGRIARWSSESLTNFLKTNATTDSQ